DCIRSALLSAVARGDVDYSKRLTRPRLSRSGGNRTDCLAARPRGVAKKPEDCPGDGNARLFLCRGNEHQTHDFERHPLAATRFCSAQLKRRRSSARAASITIAACEPISLLLRFSRFISGTSSNGRTADSGSAYRGSNPCVPVRLTETVHFRRLFVACRVPRD